MDDGPDLDELIERWRGPLIGLLRAWGVADAVDLALDVFAEAWIGRARFAGDWRKDADAGPWLRGIAWNLAAAAGRRRGQTAAPLTGEATHVRSTDVTPDERLQREDDHASILAAVEGLPSDQRAAVWMCYLNGASAGQVASLLGVPRSTVHGRLERARGALAKALGPRFEPAQEGRTR